MRDKGGKEIGALLQILKGPPRQEISFASCNADTLIQLAAMHRVIYQVLLYGQQHPDLFTQEQLEDLNTRCRNNAIRSLSQLQELIRVTGGLQAAGIPHVVIKGPQLARMIYGREALKESLDLDIMLVHSSGQEPAHTQLTGMGYMQSNLNAYTGILPRRIFLTGKREVHYFNPANKCHIDLHIRPGANTYLTAGLFRDFFTRLEDFDLEGHPVQVLPPEQYFVYLCYHGALHQFSRLGWLTDIRAYLSLKRGELDYDRVLSLAREMRAERSLFIAMTLLREYFDDEIPAPVEKAMMRNRQFDFLVRNCRRMLSRDAGYGLTVRGRVNKFIYMMVLIRGVAGRIDLLYGIVMRILANWME
jgi:hypothetical protein